MSIDETLTNTTGTLIPKLAEGSSYHNYEQQFLQYELKYSTDLTDHPPPAGHPFPYSTQLPTTPDGNFDPAALFNQKYTDLYDIVDPDNPSRKLGLCQLFERGLINEAWLHIGEPPPPGLSPIIERRQVYDAGLRAIRGSFRTTAGTQAQADTLDAVGCAVTTRMVVILPFTTPRDNSQPIGRDVGCSLMAHGFGLETTTLAIPYLGVHARPFLNFDFGSRFRVPFDGLRQICPADFAPCIAYHEDAATKQWVATAAKGATIGSWIMKPFVQGCGTVDFPPNARFRWDFDNRDPALAVPSRCNGYGMRRGPGGSDRYDPYVVDTTPPTQGPDNCGLGWQLHWRQSIPGFRNQAWDVDGRPMKNWWPFLFY
jgi:hypothetical protein